MNSIYMILVAIYLFKFAIGIRSNSSRATCTRGFFVCMSLLAFIGSIIIHIVEMC